MSKFFKENYKCLIAIFSIILVAGLGTLFVNLDNGWFDSLSKPSNFIPPVVIPIVWSIIYLSLAAILCLWLKGDNLPKATLALLIINGILNVLWCLLFFTLNNTLLGLIAIVINLIFAILLVVNIYKQVPIFAYILAIYPTWLCLATCLNLATWILN